MRKLAALVLFLLLCAGCKFDTALLKPEYRTGKDGGEVFLYLMPFTQESDRLSFSISEVLAVRSDGEEFPLSVALSDLQCRDIKRQRLLASGFLPEGSYTGIAVKAGKAFMDVEEGNAVLLVPDDPVRSDFHFRVDDGKAYVLSLGFDHSGSLSRKVSFSPQFSISLPEKPVAGLIGLISVKDSGTVLVFNKKTMLVAGAVNVGAGLLDMALDQNLKRAYVSSEGEDTVSVMDIKAGEIINSIRLNVGDRPSGPALTPDGKLLLTANTGSDTVSIIAPDAFIEIKRLSVGDGPGSISVDNAGRRAYVFNTLSNTVSVIDLANMSIAATLDTDAAPLRGDFNAKGDRLFVIHEWSSYMTSIDPYSLVVEDRVYVGSGISSIKVDRLSDRIYTGKRNEALVDIYDTSSLIAIDFIETGGGTGYITLDGEENNLYLAVPEKKEIMIINPVSKELITKIDTAGIPYRVVVMGER